MLYMYWVRVFPLLIYLHNCGGRFRTSLGHYYNIISMDIMVAN